MPYSALFNAVFTATVAAEGNGKLDLNQNDRGNWTGGQVGVGKLKGSKFGISAMSYPTLDIFNLTLEDAHGIYKSDYFDKVRGDDLPPPLALLVFDAAVNSGPLRAALWLQASLGVSQDGVIGEEETIPALRHHEAQGDLLSVCAEFMAQRLTFVGRTPIFQQDTLGLSRRFMTRAFLAANFAVEGAA